MGKSLPVLNIPSIAGAFGSIQQQVSQFFTPPPTDPAPQDGRTVDDFKPHLIAMNLTKRCNLECDHCYLDATTKSAGGDDELTTEECYKLIDQIAQVNKGCLLVITGGEPLVRPDILDIARHAVKLGFMVVFGTNGMLINDRMANDLVNCQDNYKGMLVRARCAPHFKRLAYEKDPNSPITKATGYMGGGCLAGTNYARVTPNGELTPCPYMPLSAGNIRDTSFVDLWEKSDVFNSFRYPQLKGKCGDCEYTDICGGCRARPYVDHGDWLDEDQWCLYTPKGGEKIRVAFNMAEDFDGVWDEAALTRLSRIPYFLRAMVKKGVERHAREHGIPVITVELMEELRKKRFGTEAPVFKF